MIYPPKTKVMIPWFDTTGQKNWSIMTFIGEVSDRRIRREIRKFCQRNFGKQVTKEWIRKIPRVIRVPALTDDLLNAATEAFINRIEDDETKTETDTNSEENDTERAEGKMRPMQNQVIAGGQS